ncbi:macrolide 2'-phosphotransferase [Streptomyces sp. NPDC002785]|uniref:macrolide 2'-phosphotransferase n=1 Tax=Streptomyces sp. NPDC002785 TaxID=3154543 RepID=UPI00331BAF07
MEPSALSVPQLVDRAVRNGIAVVPGSAVIDESGWDFRVVHCRDEHGREWILRSPRRTQVVAPAAAEDRLLRLLRNLLPTRIPEWHIHTPEFTAYPRLPGTAAGTEDPRSLRYHWAVDPIGPAAQYLGPLARVLTSLHALPPATAGLRGTTPDQPRERIARQLHKIQTTLGLPPGRRAHWSHWLENDYGWPTTTVPVHGDVHPGHTLISHEPGGAVRLTGLLDWTNARVDDPATDFVDLYHAGGPAVLDTLLTAYRQHGGTIRKGMRDHIVELGDFLWVRIALLGLHTDRPHLVATARTRLHELGTPP